MNHHIYNIHILLYEYIGYLISDKNLVADFQAEKSAEAGGGREIREQLHPSAQIRKTETGEQFSSSTQFGRGTRVNVIKEQFYYSTDGVLQRNQGKCILLFRRTCEK